MSEFISAIDKLLKTAQTGPGVAYSWVVEAVFADPESPGGGMYATMGVFKTVETAKAFAIKLATEFKYDFLTFRHRPMKPFRPFFDEGPTVLLTEDTKFNEAVIRSSDLREKKERENKEKEELLKLQQESELKAGTPAHVARLVYLCVKNEHQYNYNLNQSEVCNRAYLSRLEELKKTLSDHPRSKDEWLTYITPLLERFGEGLYATQMKTWWDKTFGTLPPLPVESPPPPPSPPLSEKKE